MNPNGRGREGFVRENESTPSTLNVTLPEEDKVVEQAPAPRGPAPPTIEPSPAETMPVEEQDVWPIKVKLLYKPIRNPKGGAFNELTLREPRAGDINRYGNPVRINAENEVIIDERKMTFIIAALSDVLPPFIEEMDPRDWNSVAYRLRRFFLPDPAAW